MRPRPNSLLMMPVALAIGLAGCTVGGVAILPGFGDDAQADDGDDDTSGSNGEGGNSSNGEGSADWGGDDGESLDLPADDGGGQQACMVAGLDAPLPCDAQPPSATLDPIIAWSWFGPGGEDSVIVTPLIANLDDDNLDGAVDPCDTPDVIVLAVNLPANGDAPLPAGHLYLLDSVTGETKRVFEQPLDASASPALADLDDDGEVEILAFERSEELLGQAGLRRVIALDGDGQRLWSADTWVASEGGGSLAIADLDADGSPEILAPEHVLSASGELLWAPPEPPQNDSLPVAADLDGDGELEVLFGRSVYSAHGVELFELDVPSSKNTGIAAIANFDDDPRPEIYVQGSQHRIFEHDGTPKALCGGGNVQDQPVAIADTNGDGKAEILANNGNWYRARQLDEQGGCEILWSVKVTDDSVGVGTAFDFLADGATEPVYADLNWVRIFDDEGKKLVEFPRSARPSLAYPVVADADNDGAAELLIVGSEPLGGDPEIGMRASVYLVQNSDDRFAPTRRIWNQHAYHATNVREDAVVPIDAPTWTDNRSFRANPAPSYAGSMCQGPNVE